MKSNQFVRLLIGILGLLFLAWFFWQIKQVVIYFAVATVLALMGRPLIRLLRKVKVKEKTMPNWLTALTVLAAYFVMLSLFFKFLIPVLASQIEIIVNLDVESLLLEFLKTILPVVKKLKTTPRIVANRKASECGSLIHRKKTSAP